MAAAADTLAALAAAEDLDDELDELFDLSVDMLCIAGFDGSFKRVNQSLRDTFAYSDERLLSMSFLDVCHPDDLQTSLDALGTMVTGQDIYGYEHRIVRGDGQIRRVSWTTKTMPQRGYIFAAARDVTERRRTDDELRDARRAAEASRDEARRLADEHSALRRVATLVAQAVTPAELFRAVATEAGRLLQAENTALMRFDADGTGEVMHDLPPPAPVRAGTRMSLDGDNVSGQVYRTGRTARMDDYETAAGPVAGLARERGVRSSLGAPVVVEGRVWGVIVSSWTDLRAPPPDAEARLRQFTELVASAVANTLSRERLVQLAEEQAALRRVATLVARQSSPEDVHRIVAEEVRKLLGTDGVAILRFMPDGVAIMVAQSQTPWEPVPEGTSFSLEGDNVITSVVRTGRTARLDDWTNAWGDPATMARSLGIRSSVATPITVEGRLWGTMVAVSSQAEPLPTDTESRIAKFTELVATALSNAQARAELGASRARLAAAADDERRRVVRDLHDGAQQRLVHTVITLKLATQALDRQEDPRSLVEEGLAQAQEANISLRELAHGILPTVLAQHGLLAAVETLASRSPVPIDFDLSVGRLPAALEATAYFIVAEALTNVAKHARAERAQVSVHVEHGNLRVEILDDGVGGARPQGTGLVGLSDRIAALDGRLRISSPPDGGTLVSADIPFPD